MKLNTTNVDKIYKICKNGFEHTLQMEEEADKLDPIIWKILKGLESDIVDGIQDYRVEFQNDGIALHLILDLDFMENLGRKYKYGEFNPNWAWEEPSGEEVTYADYIYERDYVSIPLEALIHPDEWIKLNKSSKNEVCRRTFIEYLEKNKII